MFCNCSSLTDVNLSSFDISKTSYFTKMFYKCSQLKTIYATKDKWKIKYGAKESYQ